MQTIHPDRLAQKTMVLHYQALSSMRNVGRKMESDPLPLGNDEACV